MLKLINITKEYKVEEDSVLALNNVSIEFRKNEFVSILGPSGCGKTTLLNIVGGLDRYTDGDIQIDGVSTKEYDDVDWDTYRNRRVGFVFQSYNLIPHLSILKNVAMSLTLAGVEREERRQRAMEALEKVGLASQAKKKPNQLSGGQMQRVAIARALVNNPEIILADEPTGALDSESGIQVMDMLKEVAQDRLVVMVTHNPSLAEEYSTRIVYLKDGEIVGDSMPYDSSLESDAALARDEQDENVISDEQVEQGENVATDEEVVTIEGEEYVVEEAAPTEEPVVTEKKKKTFKERFLKWKKADKAAMKLSTAISLSWNNLLAKKGRTLLTSIAGSIGIIGIVLVLSLSNGASNYITGLEESALSTYPLTISTNTLDLNAIMGKLTEEDADSEARPSNPDSTTIYTKRLLGKLLQAGVLDSLTGENNLVAFKKYVDNNWDDSWGTKTYNYGINFNAFIQDPDHSEQYMKVNPYTEVMEDVLSRLTNDPDSEYADLINSIMGGMGGMESMLDMFSSFTSGASMFSSWTEISSNQKLLESQYELVGGKWASEWNEIIIVVDKKNQLLDYQLFMLGLQSQEDVFNAFSNGWANRETSLEELLSLEYKVLPDSAYLELLPEEQWQDSDGDGIPDETWTQHNHKEQSAEWIDGQNAETVKVVGVVRPKENTSVTSINGVVGYTHKFTLHMMDKAAESDAIVAMQTLKTEAENRGSTSYTSCINYNVNDETEANRIIAGETLINFKPLAYGQEETSETDQHTELMRKFGVAQANKPTSIEFYCASFEAKDEIVAFIERYNAEQTNPANKITYGDTLKTIMGFVNTMVTTITGVLVGFAAISLIVSTIMIAIIIYTSVLERRKEIGVLRSIGARKRDISRVFIAESAILGGYSGAIGIIISVAFSFIGSAILKALFSISGLMAVSWWQCLVMLAVSILLSMLAGFIPSRIAANKDPAIALRSE